MADILKREMAPITREAWAEIDGQARRILTGNLSARRIVDLDGPHDWTLAAVNLGSVKAEKAEALKGVQWGLRQVLPLVEIRVPCTIGIWETDNISRGSRTPELADLVRAAHQAALFEETAVYKGFKAGGIQGILEASINKPVKLDNKPEGFMHSVEQAVASIQSHGIAGPFALVLGAQAYKLLNVGSDTGYPLRKRVESVCDGGIHWSPALSGGVIVSGRGGDFELTVGQDFSIGFHHQEGEKVALFVTESMTFRVLEPGAAVELSMKGE
jgi:uncharacterized linocin/CFP29 family protein